MAIRTSDYTIGTRGGRTHLNGWYTTCPSGPVVVVYVMAPGWMVAACWGVVCGKGVVPP